MQKRTVTEVHQPIIVVTGANGFLGSEVVRCLRENSLIVRATDKKNTRKQIVDYHQADILQEGQINTVFSGATTVVHTAGLAHVFTPDHETDDSFRVVNENGTENVASAAVAEGVKHFVLISSVSVYGAYCRSGNTENGLPHPVGSYALSKYNAESRAIRIARESGMALTILRLSTLYGEGDSGNVSRLVSAIDRGRFIWIGDGSNKKSLLYKRDAARAILSVVRRPVSGIDIYNVSAPPCTMRDIVDRMASELGRKLPTWYIPAPLASCTMNTIAAMTSGYGRTQNWKMTLQKWLADDFYDTNKFCNTFDYRIETSLEEGIHREVEGHKARNRL